MILYQNDCVTVFQSQLFKTTSSVLVTKDCVILVDPNLLPAEIQEIKQYINQIQQDRPLYLVFTHSDWDHIVGYGAFPNAITIGSFKLQNHPDKQDILKSILHFDDEYYLDRNYAITYPEIDVIIESHGQKLVIGETNLTFFHTKGHSDDGIFMILENEGIWIAGDYLSDIEIPIITSTSLEYERTLELSEVILHDYSIQILVPGHGAIASNHNEIKRRIEESRQYIRTLRSAVANQTKFDTYINEYRYPQSMKTYHEENIVRMQYELEETEDKI